MAGYYPCSDDLRSRFPFPFKIKEQASKPGVQSFMAVKKQYNSFPELLAGSSTPVLVDFYATWCGPCQMMSPVLDAVKKRFHDRLTVVKIDTDKYPHLASEYHILALPTLILFKEGKPAQRFEGMRSSEQLTSELEPLL